MKKNIGTKDRVLRAGLGLIFLGLAWWFRDSTVIALLLLAAALFSFYEAIMSWCLFYQLIGRNSCPID